jgi:Fic-DOC domain mobile mystery protein B
MAALKIRHIATREELNRFEQDNIAEALQWLGTRHRHDILTERFTKTLHRKMFGKVWKWAGTFRRSDKNIGVDWKHIAVHAHNLLEDVKYWVEHETYEPDEIAVRFHHRLVWIHLFPNGNGRHARLMTDVLVMNVLKREPFTWNGENIDRGDQARGRYITALRKADGGDYSLLLEYVRRAKEKQ